MSANKSRTNKALLAELEDLRLRLQEAEETLSAIRGGEVDALIVSGPAGEQVFALKGAERPYRIFVESMHEGAISLTKDGAIIYCNGAFTQLAGIESSQLVGSPFRRFITEKDVDTFEKLWNDAFHSGCSAELELKLGEKAVPVFISLSALEFEEETTVFAIVTDITERKQAETASKELNQTLEHRIAERTSELEAANLRLRESRTAALNMMEDAVIARRQAEEISTKLQQEAAERKKAEDEIRRRVEELRQANEELARFNKAAVGREVRMIELKKEVNELSVKAGEPPRYPLEFEE